jgi:hypothetical protein
MHLLFNKSTFRYSVDGVPITADHGIVGIHGLSDIRAAALHLTGDPCLPVP